MESRVPMPYSRFPVSLSTGAFPSLLSQSLTLSTTSFPSLCYPNPFLLPYNATAILAFQQSVLKNSLLTAPVTPIPPKSTIDEAKSDVITMFPFVNCSIPSSSTTTTTATSSPESLTASVHSQSPNVVKRGRKSHSPAECKCTICGKTFSRQWLLQGHIRTHTGEKPFGCTVCHKSFADKSNLRAHVQTHSGVKPYECSRCGKKFALRSYLSKHEESACFRQSPGRM